MWAVGPRPHARVEFPWNRGCIHLIEVCQVRVCRLICLTDGPLETFGFCLTFNGRHKLDPVNRHKNPPASSTGDSTDSSWRTLICLNYQFRPIQPQRNRKCLPVPTSKGSPESPAKDPHPETNMSRQILPMRSLVRYRTTGSGFASTDESQARRWPQYHRAFQSVPVRTR